MMKKISVIVPVYNSIDCLERCVRSICAQTYSDLEIILAGMGVSASMNKANMIRLILSLQGGDYNELV